MPFRAQLDLFSGPMDLLWYLVRKHELNILEVSIAQLTDQYLEMLVVLEEIDVNAAGDFLDLATRLMEAKSRSMLPRQEEETEEEVEDSRHDLVQRLLEYKKYKDAANVLETRGREWQDRFARRTNDLPTHTVGAAEQPIQDVELWDLVSAFARVVRDNATVESSSIRYDDTPIEVHMQRIRERLEQEPRLLFTNLFKPGMTRSHWVGIFLAILELIRHAQVEVEQEDLFGEIWVLAGSQAVAEPSLRIVDEDMR